MGADKNPPDQLICEMLDVRGSDTGFPVQLIKEGDIGRIVVRAINEGGFSCTDVDLFDLLTWLNQLVPQGVNIDGIARGIAALSTRNGSGRHQ